MTSQDTASERDSLLTDPQVQSLVQRMVDQGVYSIHAKVDSEGISYPLAEAVLGTGGAEEVDEFLLKLVKGGVLNSKLLDKVIACPTCGSPSVYSKYNCPRCSSYDIGKATIIEHIRCGYIGSKDKFQKVNRLICPKCKGTLSEMDYRNIGTSFECNTCNSRFEAPKITHKCSSCEEVFSFKEAKYEPIREYALSEETKHSIARGTVPLSSIATVLKEKGFKVGIKEEISGKSGAAHVFDIVARKGKQLVVANFTFQPKEEDIIGLFAKKYDVEPTLTLLIALTPPTKEEEAVSKAYGVTVLSYGGLSSLGKQILELLDSA